MNIIVHAKPGSQKEKIERIGEHEYRVSVKEPPVQGLANKAIIGLLSVYFNISSARIRIRSGYTSRKKIIEIIE